MAALPTILLRAGLAEEGEAAAARRAGFNVAESRTVVLPGTVIGRYSVLPYYRELEADLAARNARLVNSWAEHQSVADLLEWQQDDWLRANTPRTWASLADAIAQGAPGPFVLKGATNSRKHLWRTHMFARDLDAARAVHGRLLDDCLIGQQPIRVRDFEDFETCDEGVNGLPVTNEWRYFAYRGRVLAGGFYWSEHADVVPPEWLQPDAGRDAFAARAALQVAPLCPFAVVDVARHADGRWRVVELNDGQMSGLSMVDARELYRNLALVLGGRARVARVQADLPRRVGPGDV